MERITEKEYVSAIKKSRNFIDLKDALKKGFALQGTIGNEVIEINVQVDTEEWEWVQFLMGEDGDAIHKGSR